MPTSKQNRHQAAGPRASGVIGGRKLDRITLLERIDELGSISAAARSVGVSYKAAWEAIDALNGLSPSPLVVRTIGGKAGGGTALTAHGRKVVQALRNFERRQQSLRAALGEDADKFEHYCQMFRELGLRTSARNQFRGCVTDVIAGPISAQVILDIGGGSEIAASITTSSVENLGLAAGMQAIALFKAPSVTLVPASDEASPDKGNRLCGKVSRCHKGQNNIEVVLGLANGKQIAALVSIAIADSLQIKEGVRLCARVEPSQIIIAVE